MLSVISTCDLSDPNGIERQLVRRIADQWVSLVLYHLVDGEKRFNELWRALNGVSQKMLAQTLRSLERDGFVERRVYPVVPPKVEYRLTALGESLVEPLGGVWRWAAQQGPEVERARTRYDAAARQPAHEGSEPRWPSEEGIDRPHR